MTTSAAAAWARGRETGDVAWLRRAVRLALGDPRVVLDLAVALLGPAPGEAAGLFAGVARRWDVGAAWIGLAVAGQRAGDVAGARTALAELWARHEVPAGVAGLAAAVGFVAPGQDAWVLRRVVGVVEARGDRLAGWVARPAAAEGSGAPEIHASDATGAVRPVRLGRKLPPDDEAPFLQRFAFSIPVRGPGPFRVFGPDGRDLLGSPLDPAVIPAPKKVIPSPIRKVIPRKRALAVVIPVYRGAAETQACLNALLANMPRHAGDGTEIIVVNDASPEPDLLAWISQQNVTLLHQPENRGFVAAANAGFAAARGRDVLLLNADTVVPPGAIAALRAAAYADAGTGTVTPFSNEATICSYPDVQGGNPMPESPAAMQALAAAANGARTAEIPTAHGFCMYIRHDCLAATGPFRPELFAQGYGEENDFCMRARRTGFRHVAALGAYVAHQGGVSFRAAARALTARNLRLLNRIFPGYDELIFAHIAADPLRAARARMDALRLGGGPRPLLISHSHGGGVGRQVAAQMAALRAAGENPLLLMTAFPRKPKISPYPWRALLTAGDPADFPNLSYNLETEFPALLRVLKNAAVTKIILHHTLGHHQAVRDIPARLRLPYEIVVHDYGSFCRRVNLLRRQDGQLRYCGEPDIAGCIACCRTERSRLYEPLPVRALLARSTAEFAAAVRITAPSADAARRITRHFPGTRVEVTHWEDDSRPLPLRPPPPPGQPRRIAVIGGIGPQKGFDILLACAADATARALPLSFTVIGGSADDATLLAAGIFVTGHYRPGEAVGLIKESGAHIAFLPSLWPETWCFTLSEAWEAGLYAVTFDLGAQAARVRATGRGIALPPGLPTARINDTLLAWRDCTEPRVNCT
jgi:GT2 family glycosyltransferase/glycosyltransferase involved in cell wall biosynthesis